MCSSDLMSGLEADFTSFSFHAVKNFTTAEGGAVTWRPDAGLDDEDMYRQFMLASLHGQNKDALAKAGVGAWEYDIIYPAYKCNMTDITAAIGLIQLDRYPGLLARRREIISKYDETFVPMGMKRLVHFKGMLRDELGVLPAGDVRQCLVALSSSPKVRLPFIVIFLKFSNIVVLLWFAFCATQCNLSLHWVLTEQAFCVV